MASNHLTLTTVAVFTLLAVPAAASAFILPPPITLHHFSIPATTTTTSAAPTAACTPSTLQDADFSEALGVHFPWVVGRTSEASLSPNWEFEPGTPNYFDVDFPDPEGAVSLNQTSITVCNGWNEISFYYMTTLQNYTGSQDISTIAGAISNCTITSGLTGVWTDLIPVPWDSQYADSGNWLYFNAVFDSTSLPAGGLNSTFFMTFACPNATWWPRVMVKEPNVARPFS